MNGKSVQGWWAKVAGSVIRDTGLSASAKVVFCELALWARRGNPVVSRGQRAIADAVGLHQETVCEALKELARRGHLTASGTGRERKKYQLSSFVYHPERKVRMRKAA